MAELVLSASSADAYRTCGWRWYLEYVEQVGQISSVAAAVGLAVHEGVEAYYRLRLDGMDHETFVVVDEFLEGVIEIYEARLAMELAGIPEEAREEDAKKARASGRRTLVAYIEDVAGARQPLFVEEGIRFDVNGIPYSMHVDLIDVADGLIVDDLKVKNQKPRDPGRYAFQMNGNALGSRLLTGRVETDVRISAMIRLKRDRPYLVPITNGGPVTSSAAGIFAAQLEAVAEGIAKGRFDPTGLETGACKWCPVRHACEPYEEFMNAR